MTAELKLFAVQAFKAEGFSLVPQLPQRCDTEREARNLAARLFKNYPAVIAWAMPAEMPPGSRSSPEILLRIGRVPDRLDYRVPEQAPRLDLLDELLAAASHLEATSRAELLSLLRRSAAEIAALRTIRDGGHSNTRMVQGH